MLLKDIIKEVVDIVTLPVKEVAKRVKEAGAEVADKIRETVETAFAKGFEFFFPEFLERLKVEIAKESIKEEIFQTEEVKEAVRKLKDKWKKSPQTPSDIAHDILDIIVGKASKVQLEAITGVEFGADTPVSQKVFDQVAIITDICLLSNILQIVGEILSLGQIDTLGKEIREYLDYSGLSQLVGYGYGMLLSSVLSPLIAKEINAKLTPELPTVTEALRMYYRGILKEEDFKAVMRKLGFSDTYINALKQDYLYYPTPTDFIRFSVREVFTDDKETQEALRAEFPEEIVEHAKKAGMDKDVLMWYWMSHWELPSPTQVYEMLHRLNPEVLKVRGKAYESMGLDVGKLETTLDTVKQYLKQADYDIRWRDRLVAISYYPLTRTDLRRIYELGLIDEEELLARLMEVGYTKEDALKLVEFYKTYKMSAEKDLTRTQILDLMRIGEITEEECKKMLMDIGYDDVEADFIIALEKYKMAEEELKDQIDVYKYMFEEGLIDEKTFTTKLDELGIRATRRDKIVLSAVRSRNRRIRLPTKEDILKWYANKQITEERARELLSRINIPEEFHDLYLGKKEEKR